MKSGACFILLIASLAGCLADGDAAPPVERNNFAQAILWSEPSEVIVEVHHVEGREPTALSLQRLYEELEAQTSKSTITILPSQEVQVEDSSQEKEWTGGELHDLHERTFHGLDPSASGRISWLSEDAVVIHLMFLNGIGRLAEDRYFIGLQTVPALFILADTTDDLVGTGSQFPGPSVHVDDPSDEPFSHAEAEAAIVVHELGHAMGLVGREADMVTPRIPPEDIDQCQCHSSNRGSVMYPGTESFNLTRYIEEGRPVVDNFDADDLADLARLRGMDPYDK